MAQITGDGIIGRATCGYSIQVFSVSCFLFEVILEGDDGEEMR